MSRARRLPLWTQRLAWGEDFALTSSALRSGRLTMGRHTYGNPRVLTFAGDDTTAAIGSFTSIARGVTLVLGGNHPLDRLTTYPLRLMWGLEGAGTDGYPWSKGDISVGSDVWLGLDSMILSGVTIGHGAIVAARSVVTADIPPYAVAAGSPARIVRSRLPETDVARMLDIAWWEWDDTTIREAVSLLTAGAVDPLAAFAERVSARPTPSAG